MNKILMRSLAKYFNFYIYANIHVAIAAMCLTKITLFELKIEDNISPAFVLLSTVLSYNFIRYANSNKIVTESSTWIKTYALELRILNFLCFVGLILLVFYLNLKSILVLLPFALATIFYISPLSVLKINLRDVPGTKLFLIAFSWAGVTVLFPSVQNGLSISDNLWLLFLERFLFIVGLTIPFDIRDIDYDSPKLFTLPQVLGVKQAKFISLIALVTFIILTYYRSSILNDSNSTNLIIGIIAAFFVIFSSENQNKYYSNFWIESLPILWFVLVLFFY